MHRPEKPAGPTDISCGECYIAAHELFSSCSRWGLLDGVWASHRGGFSCCRAQALGPEGFSSYQVLAQ